MNIATGHRYDSDRHIPVFNTDGWRVAYADQMEPEATLPCGSCGKRCQPRGMLMFPPGEVTPFCYDCIRAFVHSRWPHLDMVTSKRGDVRGVITHEQLQKASWMKGDRYA